MPTDQLQRQVLAAIDKQPITDLHTHTYPPSFGAAPKPGGLLLWGIDELVTYHYLVAEVYRVVPATELPYEKFWAMSKQAQADHIWTHLFVERTPISEACRGVLTCLSALGLDPNEKSLTRYRKWFGKQDPDKYIDKVMELAHVDQITMTNPVFDDQERAMWERDASVGTDPRFTAVLRIDPLLRDWPNAAAKLRGWGYDAREDFSGPTVAETQRFLRYWLDRMKAVYVAMSLPPEFRYPRGEYLGATGSSSASASTHGNTGDSSPPDAQGTGRQAASGTRFIAEVLMPVLAERGLPWAMMIGSRFRDRVNPALRDAGDMVGKSDVQSVVNLCRQFPNNKFMVTMLAREDQHELCVATRKFGNLLLFGCWWFLNNPSLIEEITRMRVELLGTSFAPEHSDARVLDQLIYKWEHSRRIIGSVLVDKYRDLEKTGFKVTPGMIKRDVGLLLRENYRGF